MASSAGRKRWQWFAAVLVTITSGCSAMNPVRGLPSQYYPREAALPTKTGQRTIDLSLLRQTPPETYRLDRGDVLGVYIEGVLGRREEVPPVHFPLNGETPPSLGYPIPVRDDGTISLPLVKPIVARGLSVAEIEEAIRRAYTEERQILQPGQDRILVSLQRPRVYNVLVIRQEAAGGELLAGSTQGSLNPGLVKRGTGKTVSLPAYNNDVLHALAETGGLPGLDAENTIYVLRRRGFAGAAGVGCPAPGPGMRFPGAGLPAAVRPGPVGAMQNAGRPGAADRDFAANTPGPRIDRVEARSGLSPQTQAVLAAGGRLPPGSRVRQTTGFGEESLGMTPEPEAWPGPGFTRPPGLHPVGAMGSSMIGGPVMAPGLPPGLPPEFAGQVGPGTEVIRIPVRLPEGDVPRIHERDIVLQDGDIVFIESRETEIFYVGGLLGGGQFSLPRDYDLDVLGAISIATSRMGTSSGGGGFGNRIGGVSSLNQDISVGASDCVILRPTRDGGQIPIKVDLNKALRDPKYRVRIEPGDHIVLQYKPHEAVAAFVERNLLAGGLIGLAATTRGGGGGGN